MKTGILGGGAVLGAAVVLGAMAGGTVLANALNMGAFEKHPGIALQSGLVQVADAADLTRRFSEMNYHLPAVRKGSGDVPRVILANLPADLVALASAEQRKTLFIQSILPLVLQANEEILLARERLIAISALPSADRSYSEKIWLLQLGERYDTEPGELEELLRRVDAVPPSLALAQAAFESGWGTSRFAQEANAVFGQWTYEPSQGLAPAEATEDTRHYVRAFEGLPASVAGYLLNLNTHFAYASFRNRRKIMRDQIGDLDPFGLANTLLYYSETRGEYVAAIRLIIERNHLTDYDRARLRDLRGAIPILRF